MAEIKIAGTMVSGLADRTIAKASQVIYDEKKKQFVTGKLDDLDATIEEVNETLVNLGNKLGSGEFVVGKAAKAVTVVDGAITHDKLDANLQQRVNIVDNLETENTNQPLSANQGVVLRRMIGNITTDVTYDENTGNLTIG